jgi:hypothetical protein
MNRRRTEAERRKDKDFGEIHRDERIQNCQNVFDIILMYGKVTTTEIQKTLENWNSPLSKRTIQRCIEDDSRIVKDKRYYSISQEARFETKYRDPKKFGPQLIHEVLNTGYGYNKESMKNMINAFGAIMMFAFIEASRPFVDKVKGKGISSTKDKDDLVQYWASKAIPIEMMFQAFNWVFTRQLSEIDLRIPIDLKKPAKVLKGPYNEMTEDQVKECHMMLRKIYPDIYEGLKSARKKFVDEINQKSEIKK